MRQRREIASWHAEALLKFIGDGNGIEVLNVAGPRWSKWVGGGLCVCVDDDSGSDNE